MRITNFLRENMERFQITLKNSGELQRFLKDNRGALTTGKVIDLMVIALLVGILIPIGLNEIANANTSTWSSSSQTIWNNLDVIILIAILLGIIEFFRVRGN